MCNVLMCAARGYAMIGNHGVYVKWRFASTFHIPHTLSATWYDAASNLQHPMFKNTSTCASSTFTRMSMLINYAPSGSKAKLQSASSQSRT